MRGRIASGRSFGGRTQAQRDFVTEQRARAIESGEFAEKLGLHELAGLPPPMGRDFRRGESIQDLRVRAAQAGLYLPGSTSPALAEVARLKNLEREQGLQVMNMPVKERFAISQGLDGGAAWDIPDLIEYDFSTANVAGAGTIPGTILGIMPGTNAPGIGSPDDIGPALAAATATRVVGSGSKHYATVLAFWVFARTAAGAVYVAAAGTTLTLAVISAAVGAAQIRSALTAAYNVNTGTTFWTNPALTVPAERQPSPFGVIIATMAMIFFGDVLVAELVTTGVLNVQTNTLAAYLEIV